MVNEMQAFLTILQQSQAAPGPQHERPNTGQGLRRRIAQADQSQKVGEDQDEESHLITLPRTRAETGRQCQVITLSV